jgi:hypothetical protein
MEIIERIIFITIIWIPIVALISAITLLIAGVLTKYEGKSCKKYIIISMICLAITVAYYLILFITGMDGFGPGVEEARNSFIISWM